MVEKRKIEVSYECLTDVFTKNSEIQTFSVMLETSLRVAGRAFVEKNLMEFKA